MRYSTSIKIRLLVRQSQDVPVMPKKGPKAGKRKVVRKGERWYPPAHCRSIAASQINLQYGINGRAQSRKCSWAGVFD